MQKRLIVILGIVILTLIPSIYADVSPIGYTSARLEFTVTFDNQPIQEDFWADILMCSDEGCESDNHALCINGICYFSYYRNERVPPEMKLQVSLHNKTFISDIIKFKGESSAREYYYDVNISPDGQVAITANISKTKSSPPVLLSFAYAFVLTILIEIGILIIFLRKWKVKKWKMPILSLVLADIISLPLVWIIFIFIGVVMFFPFFAIIVAEAFAVIFEAYFIHWLNKKAISLKRAFTLSIVMNIASFVIGGIILGLLLIAPLDLGSPVQEKEFTFDASKYTLDLDDYPELSEYKTDISERHAVMLQEFYEEFFEGHEFECFSDQTVSKLNFNGLRPRQDLYLITSDCGIPGDTMRVMYEIMFYVTQGNIVMFQKKEVSSHFTEAFSNIESLEELKEYAELYVDDLAVDLNSAIDNAHWSGLISRDFDNGCEFTSDIPELDSTVSKDGDGFVYEGLRIEPELHARVYYLRYSIAPDGQVVKDKEDMLALCEKLGIIY